jgi:hypothetical protein
MARFMLRVVGGVHVLLLAAALLLPIGVDVNGVGKAVVVGDE